MIRRNFSTSISRELSKSKLFDTKFILDFQVANSGVRVGKKSFLSFQLMLKQKSGNILPFKEIKEACESTLLSLIDNMVDSISDDFLVSKTKKETIYITQGMKTPLFTEGMKFI